MYLKFFRTYYAQYLKIFQRKLVDWVFRVTEKSKKNIAQNLLKFVKLSDSGVKLKKEVKI